MTSTQTSVFAMQSSAINTTDESSGTESTNDPLMTSFFAIINNTITSAVTMETTSEATEETTATMPFSTRLIFTEDSTTSESIISGLPTNIPNETSTNFLSTTNPISTTAFASTTVTDQVTATTPFATTSDGGSGGIIGGLELPYVIIIAVAAAIVVVALIVLCICCKRRRKEKYSVKQQKKVDEMWSLGTGGVEVPMINITAKSKGWKDSTESIDDKITTAVVMEQPAVNVFAQNSRRSSLGRSGSARSRSSAGSIGSSNPSSSKANTFKARKPLTKVEGPTIKIDDIGKTSGGERGDDEATSDANSVFTDTPHTPTSAVSGYLGGKSSFEALSFDDKKKTGSSAGGSQDGTAVGSASDNQEDNLPPPPPPPPSD